MMIDNWVSGHMPRIVMTTSHYYRPRTRYRGGSEQRQQSLVCIFPLLHRCSRHGPHEAISSWKVAAYLEDREAGLGPSRQIWGTAGRCGEEERKQPTSQAPDDGWRAGSTIAMIGKPLLGEGHDRGAERGEERIAVARGGCRSMAALRLSRG
jgi:hypothetical protein